MTNASRYPIILSAIILVLVALALVAESVYFSDFEYRFRTKMFNKTLQAEETVMESCLNSMKPILAKANHHGSETENNLFSTAERNKISILEYIDNKLIYWSDNDFEVPSVYSDSVYSKPLVFLQNGWFLTKSVQAGNEKIIGLLKIHTDYGFENNIIRSGFVKEFSVSPDVGLSLNKNDSDYHIFDKEGHYLFALTFPEIKGSTNFILIPLCLWAGVFVILLFLALYVVRILSAGGKNLIGILISLLCFSFIYLFILYSGKPVSIFHTELFSPYRFTLNSSIPSLGHLLVLSILAAAFSYIVFRYFPVSVTKESKGTGDYFKLTVLLLGGMVLFCVYHWIFSHLISTSNINFETYKVLDLNLFSVAGFASGYLLLMVPVFYLLKIFQTSYTGNGRDRSLPLSLLTSAAIPISIFHQSPGTFIPLIVFYSVLVISIRGSVRKKIGMFNTSVIFSVITGIYFLYFITVLSDQKTTENLKIQAVSYSTENDPEAEHLLLDMWPEMEKDTTLSSMMKVDVFDKDNYEKISSYLEDTYFTGFWKTYHFSITLCQAGQPLQLGSEKSQDCFDFYNELIIRNGHKLTGTDFYFIDNQGGRSHYLCRVFYNSTDGKTNGLFIQLYNDVNIFQPGYSELLLDQRFHEYSGLKDYSFAKYINGDLVLRTGEFPYDKTDAEYIDKLSDFRLFETDGFKQVLFKNGNVTVIIGRPELTPGDIIISFAYLFAFILLFSNLFILMIRRPVLKGVSIFNFRQKLQLSYIGILLFSFIMIGIVVAYITIGQYKAKHYENIKEKLNSVYLELDSRLSSEKFISADSSLNEFLIKLSNVFNTDINLYDLQGFLIATSRQEIFYRNLMSQRINNMAFINLDLTKNEYYQTENIGNLEYLSAYIPFVNTDNKVIAFLNLPYFRMQSVLAKEISNLIVAVINFTLLLIVITMGLAVFISERLTSPLSMLSEGLATVGVGKRSEHLTYNGNDEIGELVKKYNRMVDEIEESTHKLANSEREYAWREMAKQIAHEIKNPLTPMKLNVQQLLKSWNDKVPGFDKNIERFTRNQIEYIDNLSSIASAFSAFAKMPVTNPVEVNILDQLRISLELYKNTDNVSFHVRWPHENKIVIYADKEQLNGVFSNLIKNGIQSIPSGKPGEITLGVDVKGDKVITSVSDNGSGIPADLRKNLFTPNFTTKSSGMGLGLSIAKKYIESAGGRIWFESETGKGSVFYFELPVLYTVEKP